MENLLNNNIFLHFSLDDYYFTDKSIIIAVVNYLRSLNLKCNFKGFNTQKRPVLEIDTLNYEVLYSSTVAGLISLDNLSLNKISNDIQLDSNCELSKNIKELIIELN